MHFPNEWVTFQGKKVTLDTIDHQHLSNIYWYFLIIHGYTPQDLIQLKEELEERFNGQLMEYRPHTLFKEERDRLLDNHHLMWESSTGYWGIYYKGQRVGQYIEPLKS